MAKSAQKSTPPANFEDALTELESLVQTMERGDLALEASLASYQRGVALLRYCQEKLGAAEDTIRILEEGELRPMAPPPSGSVDENEED